MSKQKGLPTSRKMRHDFHFVENLTARKNDSIGRLIPIEKIDLNPSQPREQVGDLTDLVSSIKEKGVLEPVLVSPRSGRFQIIAGERRYRASLKAGLSQLPCITLLEISSAQGASAVLRLPVEEDGTPSYPAFARLGRVFTASGHKVNRAFGAALREMETVHLPVLKSGGGGAPASP